jgi:hypothetical protein
MRQAVFADIISYILPHALWAVHFCSLIAIYRFGKEESVVHRRFSGLSPCLEW